MKISRRAAVGLVWLALFGCSAGPERRALEAGAVASVLTIEREVVRGAVKTIRQNP